MESNTNAKKPTKKPTKLRMGAVAPQNSLETNIIFLQTFNANDNPAPDSSSGMRVYGYAPPHGCGFVQ